MSARDPNNVLVVGAGPAGLTAAYHLTKHQVEVDLVEKDPTYVGGISRTVQYKGFGFDIGGHRFFSKSQTIEALWTEILPDDFLVRPRSSRIFYNAKFFSYPLKPVEALVKLGFWKSTLCMLSYFKARAFPIRNPKCFEDWVTNQFGRKLFEIFFKTYTEKVWGMSCRDISADWAAQRIKGLSLGSAVVTALLRPFQGGRKSKAIKSLIESFRYPRRGPGMMWDACAEKVKKAGGRIWMNSRIQSLHYENGIWETTVLQDADLRVFKTQHLISSMPVRELLEKLEHQVSPQALEAARSLKYRDFLIVVLILKDQNLFPDNWVYIHDPRVKVGRIQNFKSWSEEMVPDPAQCSYGMEYFCFEGDGLWNSTDAELLTLAKKELELIGFAKVDEILDGCVVRQKKAYPVYDDRYQASMEIIRKELAEKFPTLHLVGRNGMHKYDNQDHAMMTALLTAENILNTDKVYDIWKVNEDAEYHEEGSAGSVSSVSGLRSVPQSLS
jgi:protoporphyrinogen oxidase